LIVISTVISAIFAVFIIVSTCNATNLLDGLDGLCSGVTGVMSWGTLFSRSTWAVHGANTGLLIEPRGFGG